MSDRLVGRVCGFRTASNNLYIIDNGERVSKFYGPEHECCGEWGPLSHCVYTSENRHFYNENGPNKYVLERLCICSDSGNDNMTRLPYSKTDHSPLPRDDGCRNVILVLVGNDKSSDQYISASMNPCCGMYAVVESWDSTGTLRHISVDGCIDQLYYNPIELEEAINLTGCAY